MHSQVFNLCYVVIRYQVKLQKKMNLIDDIATKNKLLNAAKSSIQSGLDPVKPWDKKGFKLPSGKIYSPAGFQFWPAANAIYRRETHDNYPGGRGILQSVYEGLQLPFDLALEVESRIFANVIRTKEAKNMIRTLFLSLREINKGARRPSDIPKNKITKIGVLGAGFMGQVSPMSPPRLALMSYFSIAMMNQPQKGKSSCESITQKAIKRKKMKSDQATELLNLIKPTSKYEDLKDCDLVIEAVFEDREIKKAVTIATEEQIGTSTVFASNTSTLPITSLAQSSNKS